VENRLNDLNGSQWLYWTNSIYETNFPPDQTFPRRKAHGAMKPPELMAEIITFFTKAGEVILDPFAGVGGTLLGAELTGRRAVGIELNPEWVRVYQELRQDFRAFGGAFVPAANPEGGRLLGAELILGDCLAVMRRFPDESFAAIITDPPYGCHHRINGFKEETNFSMFSINAADFGNSESYQDYLEKIRVFGNEALRILQPKRYLVLLIGDRFHRGEYLPLGTMVAETLRNIGFRWKGIRIWWNKATQRPLKPYAVKSCFVPNITHQNIIILRKES
jgi:DNA modification methylase